MRIQQLKTNEQNMTTWVHQGERNKLVLAETLDQSSERLRKPMPPNPEPRKLAVLL